MTDSPFPGILACEDVTADARPYGIFCMLVLRGRAKILCVQWQLKSQWLAAMYDPATPTPSSEECQLDGDWRRGGHQESLTRLLLHLFMYSQTSWTGWRVHLQDLTAAEIWSSC